MGVVIAPLALAVQADAVEFLEAVVKDLKAGIIPAVSRGVMIMGFEAGTYSVWEFGPKNGGAFTSMAMCALGQQMLADTILGG